MRTGTARTLAVAIAALSLVAISCGGDDDSDSDATAATAETSGDETTATTTAETTAQTTGQTTAGAETTAPTTEDGTATTGSTEGSEPAGTGGTDAGAELWDDGPCDDSQPTVVLGATAPIEAPGISLKPQVDGTQAAVDAFNERGGLNGRCLELKVCDGKNDKLQELDCVRQFLDDESMVAMLGERIQSAEPEAYPLIEEAGMPQVGAQPTQPAALASPMTFEWNAGGIGITLAPVPALHDAGVTKFAWFIPESDRSASLGLFADPVVKALGMELLDTIQVPPTATDFTQFVIRAKNSGAEGAVLSLPEAQATEIIEAITSLAPEIKLGASWGTFPVSAVSAMDEEVAGNMAFTDATPPMATDRTRFPGLDLIAADFEGRDEDSLAEENVNSQAIQGWLAVYSFLAVMRESGATEITRASIVEAMNAAQNVPMLGLVPDWTPSRNVAADFADCGSCALFTGVSNSLYWTGSWDSDAEEFVVNDEQADIVALLAQGGA
jgi:branched-chain amino acid transport system substrate-binding protein